MSSERVQVAVALGANTGDRSGALAEAAVAFAALPDTSVQAAKSVFDVQPQMRPQLGVELPLLPPAAEQVDDQRHPRSYPVHVVSVGARNFARMAFACAQSSVARASCRRPALVRR